MAELRIESEVLVLIESGNQSKKYIIPWTILAKPNHININELVDFATKNIFKTMLQGKITVLEVQATIPYFIQTRKPRNTPISKEGKAIVKRSWDDFLTVDEDYKSPFTFL